MGKIRMGMVGGGPGAFIGPVHRMAAALDGQIELVCGAFSSDPVKSRITGAQCHLNASRVYGSYKDMMEAESRLPPGERMDFVAIVTPNDSHCEIATCAVRQGFHVLSDKPAGTTSAEVRALALELEKSGLLYALSHNYTGYPMVRQARHMLGAGEMGPVRKVFVEYPQGWLSTPLDRFGHKQAEWRTDPARAGAGGCLGDIGTHAANLLEFTTGLPITEVCADLGICVPERRLDDDCSVLLRLGNGARGVLMASQVSAGDDNDLTLRVYCEKGGLEWHQAQPNTLLVKWLEGPIHEYRAGGNKPLCADALAHCRLPAGHPEGYLEAFANVYRHFAGAIAGSKGDCSTSAARDYPGISEGLRGLLFIETVIASSNSDKKWLAMPQN